MEDLKRDFKGIWIPKEVWLDDRLSALDKIILVEIDSLDINDEGCYASNKYLADFCQCTETKMSTSIRKLCELGYLEVINFDGRKRFLKSNIKEIENQTLKNLKADFKKVKGRVKKNERQTLKNLKADFKKVYTNNIYNNTINNTINNNIDIIKDIITYLNEITDSKYRYSTKATQQKINARIREGYTYNDFIEVINKKYEEWKDTEFEKYLCPDTLFGTKFEKYLNQKNRKVVKSIKDISISEIDRLIEKERSR